MDDEGDHEVCKCGKSRRVPRKKTLSEARGAAKAYERVFSDVDGTMKYMFIDKSRYFVTILDSYSVLPMVQFVGRKSEVASAVMEMVHELENIMISKLLHLTRLQKNNVKWLKTDGRRSMSDVNFRTK